MASYIPLEECPMSIRSYDHPSGLSATFEWEVSTKNNGGALVDFDARVYFQDALIAEKHEQIEFEGVKTEISVGEHARVLVIPDFS